MAKTLISFDHRHLYLKF